ncbi:hypothetical protein RHSIM_Rhsim08G0056500 [Rhododendron simsii]|uniref:Uncharacterized protein n=1 Tax=Rhododendron simsii TaxID=118357 RepID=A0A834GJN3_RHOSS|nr:hypothetical protein RHSIM_Rhsim08G0056500 [Rhododendron simsii]
MESTAETTPDVSPKDSDDEMHDMLFARRGCCHWNIPIFSSVGNSNNAASGPSWIFKWERISNSSPEKEEESAWWLSAFKKLREWSELVAGPRWKTFIRRFNKTRGGCCGMRNGKLFQYDPLSYALNFDDGVGQNGHFDFSSRYAAIPVSAKSSIDLGRDALVFR